MKKIKSIVLSAWALISTSTMALAQDEITIPTINPVDRDLDEIIQQIAGWAMGIAAGIAILYLIYGGIVYITGGEKGAEGGKKIIVNSVIGLAIIALAGLIVTTVLDIIGAA